MTKSEPTKSPALISTVLPELTVLTSYLEEIGASRGFCEVVTNGSTTMIAIIFNLAAIMKSLSVEMFMHPAHSFKTLLVADNQTDSLPQIFALFLNNGY
jgi:hypothetical protein